MTDTPHFNCSSSSCAPLYFSSPFANDSSSEECDGDDCNEFGPPGLPWWQQFLWAVLFGSMVVVATGGNLIVIWIVLAHRRMRTVTNYFLVNLSVADAMVSTLNTCFSLVFILNAHWPFGEAFCKISTFVAVLSVCASVFTLVAISIDRYLAIMYPLRPRMSRMATLNITVAIWVGAGVMAFPNVLFAATYQQHVSAGNNILCILEWPDGSTSHSHDEFIYNVLLMVLNYFLPIGAMCFTYTRVGVELWGSRSIGEINAKQLESIRSKRRVVKMMIVVVIIFAVCWLPYHVYFLVTYHHPEMLEAAYIQQVYLGIYFLAMSNSMYNPIIYCWMNSRFRRGFKRVFRWCPFIRLTDDDASDKRNHATMTRYSCSCSPDQATRLERNGTVVVPLTELTTDPSNGTLRPPPMTTTTTTTTQFGKRGGKPISSYQKQDDNWK